MRTTIRLAVVAVLLCLPLVGGCGRRAERGTPTTATRALAEVDARELRRLYDRAVRGAATEAEGIAVFQRLYEQGRLRPAVRRFAEEVARAEAQAGPYLKYADQIVEMIEAELCLRGLHPRCRGLAYEPWDRILSRHDALFARGADAEPRPAIDADASLARVASLGGAHWAGRHEVEVLVDGPASWAKRRALLAGATRRIDVLTWAFYDDLTGWEGARALVAKAQAGIDVRILVDGQVSRRAPYAKVVDWLEAEAGRHAGPGRLELIRWRDVDRPFDGQHRKMLLVDDRHLVAGGMNYGDWYSHENPKEANRWRDTDIYVQGYTVNHAARIFRELWNEQIRVRKLDLPYDPQPEYKPFTDLGGIRVAVVEHRPGRDEHVLLSTLYAIEAARTTIDIENAYFVRIPSLLSALRRAMARGVRVRLLTNGATSIDETFLAHAVVTCAKELSDAGAEVYLRDGSTLHSKFLVVDGVFSSIGSYNLHPRSYRLEGEVVLHVVGKGPADRLARAFEDDLGHASRIVPGEALEIPANPLAALALRFFPDQL